MQQKSHSSTGTNQANRQGEPLTKKNKTRKTSVRRRKAKVVRASTKRILKRKLRRLRSKTKVQRISRRKLHLVRGRKLRLRRKQKHAIRSRRKGSRVPTKRAGRSLADKTALGEASPPVVKPAIQHLEKGINLIGYIRTEIGLGEACRMMAKTLEAAEIAMSVYPYTDPGAASARNSDLSWQHRENGALPFQANLFHLNADSLPMAYAHLGGHAALSDYYNIGYWAWELGDFPNEWVGSFDLVKEVWVPTTFVLDAVQHKSPVPVIKIPHAVEMLGSPVANRSLFRLPEERFLFLSMFDTHSLIERKNPLAVIEAFKRAFDNKDSGVGLVVKVNNPHDGDMNRLRELAEGYDNIYLLDEIYSRDVVNCLIVSTDCFVSLHRSEGFGLGLAEAMYAGKPVIGTNWSGNTDFMNEENACLVGFEMVQIGRDIGPYQAYQWWAEPDCDQAAHYMKRLVVEPEYRQQLAEKGQRTIRENFSPHAVGSLIRQRLTEIGKL